MTDQEVYEESLRNGCGERLAEMFALGQPPGCMTDAVFLEGHCNGSQFSSGMGQLQGDYYAGVARSHGVDPKGKVYLSGLAAFPGDPEAWVSGRGDVERVCRQRGWNCRGAVNVTSPDPAENPFPPVKIADDIVQEHVERQIRKNPEVVKTKHGVSDLREKTVQNLTASS